MVSKDNRIDPDEYLKGIQLPPGVDPFDYFAKRLLLPFSKSTIVILLVLFLFHSLVVIFCLLILVMSCLSGSNQTRWLVRTLYIRNESGGIVYNSPLYFINVGIFMTVAQMLCSASAQAYVWIELRSAWSDDYAQQALITIPLGMMHISETFCYWSVIHCFLVTVYLSRGSRGLMRWISPTRLINIFFICTPLAIAVVAAGLFSWEAVLQNRAINKSLLLMADLRQGSSVWTRLQDGSLSIDQKNTLGIQLLRMVVTLKKIGRDLSRLVEIYLQCLRISRWILSLLALFTCFVFVFLFYMLVCEYWQGRKPTTTHISTRVEHFPSWINREKFDNLDTSGSGGTGGSISILMLNKQFFYVLLRALGVFLSMMSQIAALVWCSTKGRDIVITTHWRGVAIWLNLVSGVWAAPPIAWQCWRLYADQTDDELHTRFPTDSQDGHIRPDGLDPFSPCDIPLPELTHAKRGKQLQPSLSGR